MDAQGPVRGESDVELAVEVVEDDEHVEYIETDNAVRYVAGWGAMTEPERHEAGRADRVPFFETTPFERWGETHCLDAAATAAADHVNAALGTDEVVGGITTTVEGEDRVAIVSVTSVLDREETIVEATDVEFAALVAVTPASVTATYRLDDHEYALEPLIYARSGVTQLE